LPDATLSLLGRFTEKLERRGLVGSRQRIARIVDGQKEPRFVERVHFLARFLVVSPRQTYEYGSLVKDEPEYVDRCRLVLEAEIRAITRGLAEDAILRVVAGRDEPGQ
jgi:hypothetical protein